MAVDLAAATQVERFEAGKELTAIGHGDFGSGTGCGRAEVGGEVSDGKIDLMSDGGNDGDGRGRDGAGDDFFVEAPEVFEGTAAASDDEKIAVGEIEAFGMRKGVNGSRDFAFGTFSLDADGQEEKFHPGRAAADDMLDILDDGSGF